MKNWDNTFGKRLPSQPRSTGPDHVRHGLGWKPLRSISLFLLANRAAQFTKFHLGKGKKGHSPEVVNRMYNAWWKSMILQATLWVQPYIKERDF